MKKIFQLFILLGMILLVACEVPDPTQSDWELTPQEVYLRKMVTIGNSLTMGIQSAGIKEDFQMNSYPYLIATQAGITDFQQPIVAAPGIGTTGKTPLRLEGGQLIADDLTVNPLTLLSNALLARPYDNLGITGATLHDVLYTSQTSNSTNTQNPFYDMVLRNPNFGNMTAAEQAMSLSPSLVLLWIGNNPILGAALAGSDDSQYFVPQDVFQAEYTELLTKLRTGTSALIIMGNIPNVADIPYVNTLDSIFTVAPPPFGNGDVFPKVFAPVPNPATGGMSFVPVDFGSGLTVPLLTEEQDVEHLLLPALSAYQAQGLGVPDSAAMVAMGYPPGMAASVEAGMIQGGLIPSGVPIPGSLTLTTDEVAAIEAAVDGYNTIIASLAPNFQVPVIDFNGIMNTLNTSGMAGLSGRFALQDPGATAFSLDGVHPSNAGYALVANTFITYINQAAGVSIPALNIDDFKGQYTAGMSPKIAMEALTQVKAAFPPVSN